MLAFIVGNTNLNFDNKVKKINPMESKDMKKLKNLENITKQKIEKVRNFNSDLCYDYSDVTQEYEETFYENEKKFKNKSGSNLRFQRFSLFRMKTINVIEEQGNVGTIILKYKKWIKWLDIFASILIIIGCILAQVENENFYYDNLSDRSQVVKLIQECRNDNGNFTLVNVEKYNISYLKEIKDASSSNLLEKFNFSDFENLPITLKISDFCESLRYGICIMTIFSIPLIKLGRYLEFMREYVYIEKLESK
jgi:hypothetical protein